MRAVIVGNGPVEEVLARALMRHGHAALCIPGGRNGYGVPRIASDERADLIITNDADAVDEGLAEMFRSCCAVQSFGPPRHTVKMAKSRWEWRGKEAACSYCKSVLELKAALFDIGPGPVRLDGITPEPIIVDTTKEAFRLGERHLTSGGRPLIIERPFPPGTDVPVCAFRDKRRVALLLGGEVDPLLRERIRTEEFRPGYSPNVLQVRIVQASDGKLAWGDFAGRFTADAVPLLERWADDPFPWLLGAAMGELPEHGDPVVHPLP